MYMFEKGTVDITANVNRWAADPPFLFVFASEDHNGWGITKAISENEVKEMNEDKAKEFYLIALNLLGISAV